LGHLSLGLPLFSVGRPAVGEEGGGMRREKERRGERKIQRRARADARREQRWVWNRCSLHPVAPTALLGRSWFRSGFGPISVRFRSGFGPVSVRYRSPLVWPSR
jgi:hypothetical protein